RLRNDVVHEADDRTLTCPLAERSYVVYRVAYGNGLYLVLLGDVLEDLLDCVVRAIQLVQCLGNLLRRRQVEPHRATCGELQRTLAVQVCGVRCSDLENLISSHHRNHQVLPCKGLWQVLAQPRVEPRELSHPHSIAGGDCLEQVCLEYGTGRDGSLPVAIVHGGVDFRQLLPGKKALERG